MRARHLDGERRLNFVIRGRGFDHRERSIHGELGNSAPRRTRRRLYLEQRGVHKVTRRCAESFFQTLPPIAAITIRGMNFHQLAIRPKHLDADRRTATLSGQYGR